MLVLSQFISLSLIRFPLINVLTGLSCYLADNPGLFRNFFILYPHFYSHITIDMGDDMSTVVSKVNYCMIDRYTHEYHLSCILGFQLPSSSHLLLMPRLVRLGFILDILFVV